MVGKKQLKFPKKLISLMSELFEMASVMHGNWCHGEAVGILGDINDEL